VFSEPRWGQGFDVMGLATQSYGVKPSLSGKIIIKKFYFHQMIFILLSFVTRKITQFKSYTGFIIQLANWQ
jgi:hypothetical protein